MRIVYMDETGLGKIEHEPWLVVAGVIVDADKQLRALERKIASLVARHVPDEFQEGFVFHAKELFNGGKNVFKRNDPNWPMERRFEVASDLAKIPKQLGLWVAVGQVNRRELALDFDPSGWTGQDPTMAAHAIAFTICSAHVELWMRKFASQEVCMLIVEDNQRMRKFLTDLQNTNQNPNAAKMLGTESKILPFRKIKASPLFEQKHQSPSLQIADFCAYVTKKAAVTDPRFRELWNTLRSRMIEMPNPDREFGPSAATSP